MTKLLIAIGLILTPIQAPTTVEAPAETAPICEEFAPEACHELPPCDEEDGNVDGTPCLWEGIYYIDSEPYWTPEQRAAMGGK